MTEKYEKRILQTLLDKYERSTAYRAESARAHVMLKPADDRELMEELEVPENKASFIETLVWLQKEGVIRFEWVRHEEGNLVQAIHLVMNPEKIAESYKLINRVPKAARVEKLISVILAALSSGNLERGGNIECFLKAQYAKMRDTKSVTRFFFDEETGGETDAASLNRELLRFLEAMDQNRMNQRGDCMERVLSSRLYGDSKYFEHFLKSKVISILRSMAPPEDDRPTDDDLLGEYGIVRWPEIFEMTGNLTAVKKDGSRIDFSQETCGAYINALTVRELDHVEVRGVRRIIFIENKANYVWYSLNRRGADELVLYHGGCYSPSKKQWFRMVLDAAEHAEIRHWSDIDIGGFRIFIRLKKELAPDARPWQMDRETLEKYASHAMPIVQQRYLDSLQRMLEDPEYEVFHPVIRYMIRHKIRLEQEQYIWQTDSYTS